MLRILRPNPRNPTPTCLEVGRMLRILRANLRNPTPRPSASVRKNPTHPPAQPPRTFLRPAPRLPEYPSATVPLHKANRTSPCTGLHGQGSCGCNLSAGWHVLRSARDGRRSQAASRRCIVATPRSSGFGPTALSPWLPGFVPKDAHGRAWPTRQSAAFSRVRPRSQPPCREAARNLPSPTGSCRAASCKMSGTWATIGRPSLAGRAAATCDFLLPWGHAVCLQASLKTG